MALAKLVAPATPVIRHSPPMRLDVAWFESEDYLEGRRHFALHRTVSGVGPGFQSMAG